MSESLMTPQFRALPEGSGQGFATVPVRDLEGQVVQAVARATRWLLGAQLEGRYWWGELEADTTLESDYTVFQFILGRLDSPKVGKMTAYIRQHQLEDGGWNIFPDGPAEINATVKAYFALKLSGDDADAPHMRRARERVLAQGGLESTNSYTRFYLALVGAIGWDLVPAIPPELVLLPTWFPINVYEMSSWTRAILVPLALLYACKPKWSVPERAHIDELFAEPNRKRKAFERDAKLFTWRNFFLTTDRCMKLYERLPWKPFRSLALKRIERWLLEHIEHSEGIAAIYPSMQNSILCLLELGYPLEHPIVKQQLAHFEAHEIEEAETLRIQPCVSPVWDTAIAMVSLEEAGVEPMHPALVEAATWLMDMQILRGGDWQVKNRDGEPGGWAFEFRNDWFPDVDDTAFVLMALARVAHPDAARLEKSIRVGTDWMLSMQNRDGGWGAFDRDNDLQLLNNIPFSDHNAMLDPSTADVTARAMECLGKLGFTSEHPAIKNALKFLHNDQAPDGGWYGRWGVNYVYGTSGVLRAMEAVGLSNAPECRHSAEWLHSVQNPDGGFGESLHSYSDSNWKGRGLSTASQTAWGLIGLLATVGPDDPASLRAAKYLVETQNEDGTWDEKEFTGTGFPSVFYLKYHLYRNSFPLYALARFRNMKNAVAEFSAFQPGPEGFRHRKLNLGVE
jgi:squalene-hopene/tetraprenyl-beta-curcumene cyclase